MGELKGILAGLESRLGPQTGDAIALDGGITNRNYRVRFAGTDYVVRLPGKDTALLGISREAERIAGEAAAALGIAPRVAAANGSCMVTAYVSGSPVDAAWLRRQPEFVARALRAFHDCGVELPVRFWVPDLLEDYAQIVLDRGGALPADYERAREVVARVAEVLPLAEPVPCHDDLLPANLLAIDGEEGRVMLVDWEYAGMGHRLFDLGNLAVNNDFDDAAEERLLAAYFGEPPTPAQRAALRLMRIVSDAREAAWGTVQGVVSELDFDFAAYAGQHFERLTSAVRSPLFEEWLHAAAS